MAALDGMLKQICGLGIFFMLISGCGMRYGHLPRAHKRVADPQSELLSQEMRIKAPQIPIIELPPSTKSSETAVLEPQSVDASREHSIVAPIVPLPDSYSTGQLEAMVFDTDTIPEKRPKSKEEMRKQNAAIIFGTLTALNILMLVIQNPFAFLITILFVVAAVLYLVNQMGGEMQRIRLLKTYKLVDRTNYPKMEDIREKGVISLGIAAMCAVMVALTIDGFIIPILFAVLAYAFFLTSIVLLAIAGIMYLM